jgi:uncharacterized RDD family membrane protein YckC
MARDFAVYDPQQQQHYRAEVAGFGSRLAGFLIDVVIFFAIGFGVGLFLAASASSEAEASQNLDTVNVIVTLAALLAQWIFNSMGWSPGKLAMGIRIVRADGNPPGLLRGFARTLGAIVSSIPLYLGYLWAAWDGQTQTWHDKMAGTYVVRFIEDADVRMPPPAA